MLVEDWDLWKRCLEHTDCIHLKDPLTYLRPPLAKGPWNRLRRCLDSAVQLFRRIRVSLESYPSSMGSFRRSLNRGATNASGIVRHHVVIVMQHDGLMLLIESQRLMLLFV
jgi:hypothetical protein